MNRLFLLIKITLVTITFNVSAKDPDYILLQCSPVDDTRLILISIDKQNRKANLEYRVRGVVKESRESLPVELTEDVITITDEYSTEKLRKDGFPEGMAFTSQYRISRKSLAMKLYASFDNAAFEHFDAASSVCEIVPTDELGNQI